MKIIKEFATTSLCVTTVLILCQYTSASHHHLVEGERNHQDFFLEQKHIKKDWVFPELQVYDKYFYRAPDNVEISFVEVLNQRTDGYGGHIEILSGGVGYDFAVIKFTSEMLRGFDFIVNIYGVRMKRYYHPDLDHPEFMSG